MEGPPKHIVEARQREREAAELKRQKEAILKDSNKDHTADRFVNVIENIDDRLKNQTVGLVTLDDFQKTRAELEEEDRQVAAQTRLREKEQSDTAKRAKRKKKQASKLSFGDEEDPEIDQAEAGSTATAGPSGTGGLDGEAPTKKKRITKDPTANTVGLPDRERDELDRLERERLRKEWLAEQERIKGEVIEIVYSYWDGSGHRKSVEVKKGDDIATFLGKCRAQFPELRGTTIDNLMYIKEDLIIPHTYTFYDFIINKARGKSGPLFNFDVHEDVRMVSDATREKDESHAGKVVERAWYNRFKHIFPASRWEIYDPAKSYGSYSIA